MPYGMWSAWPGRGAWADPHGAGDDQPRSPGRRSALARYARLPKPWICRLVASMHMLVMEMRAPAVEWHALPTPANRWSRHRLVAACPTYATVVHKR